MGGEQRRLEVHGFGRRHGRTTALLDIAIGNARRGEQVMFWCSDAKEAQRVYGVAADLLAAQGDVGAEFCVTRLQVRWPRSDRASVTFGFDDGSAHRRGFRASVVVNDTDVWRDPEPVFAHTVVNGGRF